MIFIGETSDYEKLTCRNDMEFYHVDNLNLVWNEIESRLASGEHMIFATYRNIKMLERLWIFTNEAETQGHTVSIKCPANLPPVSVHKGKAGHIYIRPPHSYAIHGFDEEPRMKVYPFLVDCDKFGLHKGTIGLMLKHYDSSLTLGRFKGGCWYLISASLSADEINEICNAALKYESSNCFLGRLIPEYALYKPGERIRIDCEVLNLSNEIKAAELILEAENSEGTIYPIGIRDLMLNVNDSQMVSLDWYPNNYKTSIFTIRAILLKKNRMAYGLERDRSRQHADYAEEKILLQKSNSNHPIVEVKDGKLLINGKRSFYLGTHYYPSSTFYELSYRPFHLKEALLAVQAMQYNGLRFCRIWCDPILEETSLRGMEALIELLGANGIVAEIVFFTSWARYMEVNTAQGRVRFEAVDMKDETYIGFTLSHMEEQVKYVTQLANRWKNYSNIIWDLTNEFSIVVTDPEKGIEVFRQWASKIKRALRDAGAKQPIIYGASCWDTGSENYRCTFEADIIVDHNYQQQGLMEYFTFYQNTACIKKPFITEEFGGIWFDQKSRLAEYAYRYHWFLASGNDAAFNYEWGISWLSDSLSGIPAYLKFLDHISWDDLDGFVLKSRYNYAKSWPKGSAGLCPWIASTEYGCIYPMTAYPSPTTLYMKRISQIGEELAYESRPVSTFLVLPFELESYKKGEGYRRKTNRINKCLDILWRYGIEFQVWQDDSIANIPKTASIVIYPNINEIRSNVRYELNELKQNGLRIFTGDDLSWVSDPDITKVPYEPKEQSCLICRPVTDGSLYVIFNRNIQRVYKLLGVQLEVDVHGMLLSQNNNIVMAEFKGKFSIKDLEIFSTGTIIIRSKDRKSLSDTEFLEILPMEECTIELPKKFTSMKVYDGETLLENRLIERSVQVLSDYLPYTLVIE